MKKSLSALALALLAGSAAWPAVSRMFESKPRVITVGRDPMISVRSSGAVSLLKVEKGNLLLQTSFDGGDSFEEPVRVNDVAGEVSSHHESSPQMQVRTRSEFYTVWQTRRGEGEGSTLRFARSTNWGESFQKAIDIDPPTAAGASQSFFTMNVSPKGVIFAAWLDGRDRGKGRMGTSAVYLARSTNKGVSFDKPVRVSLDVCPCCRPSIGFSGEKVHVTWRGVLNDNVRDIFVATSSDGGASFGPAKRVAEDNWVLNGCPHSGAAIASLGNRMFIAWHTVREKQNRLYLTYSDDAGETFGKPIEIAEGIFDPNHPQLLASGDRLSLVFQGRSAAAGGNWSPVGVYYREVDAAARLTPMERVGNWSGSASYPSLAFEDPGRIFVVWTEPRNEEKVVVMSRGRRGEGIQANVAR
jgi:hypothetical protein